MGNSNFLKVHINGYKEGSIQYTVTSAVSTGTVKKTFLESSVSGTSVATLRLPFTMSVKGSNDPTQQYFNVSDIIIKGDAGQTYRTIGFSSTYNGSSDGSNIIIYLMYAGY